MRAHLGVQTVHPAVCTVGRMNSRPAQPQWPSYGLVLGTKLVRLRKMRGLTQEQVADRAHLTRNTISLLERNENNHGGPADPVLSTIYRLAAALEVPPAVLLPAPTQVPVKLAEPVESLDVDLVWPADDYDLMSFTQRELTGKPGGGEAQGAGRRGGSGVGDRRVPGVSSEAGRRSVREAGARKPGGRGASRGPQVPAVEERRARARGEVSRPGDAKSREVGSRGTQAREARFREAGSRDTKFRGPRPN